MRLERPRPARARIPAAPLFGVALLSFACLAPAVFSSAARGVPLGFGGETTRAAARGRVVWIRVLPGDTAVVDGEPASIADIAVRVAPILAADPAALFVLEVRPDVPFRSMIAAYDQLEGIDVRNMAVPTQRDIREYIQRYGVDPSEIWGHAGD